MTANGASRWGTDHALRRPLLNICRAPHLPPCTAVIHLWKFAKKLSWILRNPLEQTPGPVAAPGSQSASAPSRIRLPARGFTWTKPNSVGTRMSLPECPYQIVPARRWSLSPSPVRSTTSAEGADRRLPHRRPARTSHLGKIRNRQARSETWIDRQATGFE